MASLGHNELSWHWLLPKVYLISYQNTAFYRDRKDWQCRKPSGFFLRDEFVISRIPDIMYIRWKYSGLILGLRPANGRPRYILSNGVSHWLGASLSQPWYLMKLSHPLFLSQATDSHVTVNSQWRIWSDNISYFFSFRQTIVNLSICFALFFSFVWSLLSCTREI